MTKILKENVIYHQIFDLYISAYQYEVITNNFLLKGSLENNKSTEKFFFWTVVDKNLKISSQNCRIQSSVRHVLGMITITGAFHLAEMNWYSLFSVLSYMQINLSSCFPPEITVPEKNQA